MHAQLIDCAAVGGVQWGDVNLDGNVSNLDALMTQIYFFGLLPVVPVR